MQWAIAILILLIIAHSVFLTIIEGDTAVTSVVVLFLFYMEKLFERESHKHDNHDAELFVRAIVAVEHKEETWEDWLHHHKNIVDGKIIINYTNDDGKVITLSFDKAEFAKYAEVVRAIAQ